MYVNVPQDGRRLQASLVAVDVPSDLCVLKVTSFFQKPAYLGVLHCFLLHSLE